MSARLPTTTDDAQRKALRRAIATDIYRAVERAPMTLVADGGQLATILAERIIRRVEEGDTDPD